MAPDPAATAALPPDLAVLAPLVGTWSGPGHGSYPTIEPFDYVETVTFEPTGKPFLVYRQTTRRAADGVPLHTETGYLRLGRPGQVELVVAQPIGIVEVDEGPIDADGGDLRLMLRSRLVGTTATAKTVDAVERTLAVTADILHSTLAMAAVGTPLTGHLDATLHRQR